MRCDSAERSSDLSLARSVTMKRFDTSAAWPTSRSVAGSISWIQVLEDSIRLASPMSSAAKIAPEIASAVPALSRGSNAARYSATSAITNHCASVAHAGTTKKCSCRIEDTEFASVSTGAIAGDTGVTMVVPTPAAVAPMSTILSVYLLGGILPFSTS